MNVLNWYVTFYMNIIKFGPLYISSTHPTSYKELKEQSRPTSESKKNMANGEKLRKN